MAMRRAPGGFGGVGTDGGAGGVGDDSAGAGAPPSGPMMPRPPMTGAPTGNANPNAQNGSPMIPQAPPPIQPTAGGPTSPFNIQKMLQTNMGNAGGMSGPSSDPMSAIAAQPVRRAPMPSWGAPGQAGSSAGTDTMNAPPGAGAMGGKMGDPSQGPLVMLRMLKAMGQI